MKTTFWFVAVLVCLAVARPAQSQAAPVDIVSADSEAALQLGEIGDHHRVWQRVTVETDRYANKIYRTNAAYTELETGMNVKQPDGSWVEASDEIEIVANGAIAQKTRHRVGFAVNCNSPVAIDMLTADGNRLQSRILGLAYFDSSTGQSVLIAEIKDSDGQLLMDAKNEVVYPDAFTDFRADVRYRNSKAGLEQDIILRENPPSPEEYKLNPATTRLEVLTEFFNPPVPAKRERVIDGSVDEFLDFGDLKMGSGRVFVMGEETTEIPVTKQWDTLEGRTFLIEEIPYQSVEPVLKALPVRTASLKTSPDGVRHQVSVKRLLPAVKQAKRATGQMKLASLPLSGKGVVLDYVTASSTNNFTFQGDTTYYVSGTVILSDTTTIEGGTVVKYTNTSSAMIKLTGPVNCLTSQYRPAVFTAKDDNTVGETIAGSTGVPTNTYANPALYVDYNVSQVSVALQHLRVAYATVGIQYSAVFIGESDDQFLSHMQFVNCQDGIKTVLGAEPIYLRNALFYNTTNVFAGGGGTVHGEHLTVHNASWLNGSGPYIFTTVNLTNSLLVNVTNTGTNTFNSVSTGTEADFQTVGAGSHYLANNSTNRNAGTTNINAALANALQQRTTYPPLELTNDFTVDTVLAPQAQRDTDLPDLGYHADPLDYVVSGRTLSANLTLTNGVALGTYGVSSSYGLGLSSGNFVSEGTPTRLNWIVRYNTVQEQSTTNWSASSVGAGVRKLSSAPTVNTRFTGWSVLGATGEHFYDDTGNTTVSAFSHSQFSGGKFNVYPGSVGLTNGLWQRVFVYLRDMDGDPQWSLFNNLFYGGWLEYRATENPVLLAYDNLFDGTTITKGISSASFTHDYNGYVTNQNRLGGSGGTHDVILTNSPVYLTNYLGRHYYPTNDGMLSLLLNTGSRNATNATLYHFTTTTNQVKESSSTVDIGFHYVATDTNGFPIDADGDGLADYLEDTNGDGNGANDPTSWQTYDSPNGLTGGNGLQVFTPLKH